MAEDALSTLLEQAINRELRSMLMHNEPPSREYHQFASFLQDLENRRRHYENATPSAPVTRTYAAATRPSTRAASPRPALPAYTSAARAATPVPARDPDIMDTSGTRRIVSPRPGTTRKDRGECFRCGSADHQVRDCPHPDQRPSKLSGIALGRPRSSSRGRNRSQPSSSRGQSEKGVSLE